jgi:hypothetical protein
MSRRRLNLSCTLLVAAMCIVADPYGAPVKGETAGTAPVKEDTLGTTKQNVHGGYTFYDKKGKKTSYSKINRRTGGYDYYDRRGNKIGSLRPRSRGVRNVYYLYDRHGIRRGIMSKKSYGAFQYRSYHKDLSIQSVIPRSIRRGDLGAVSPTFFVGEELVQ